MVALLGCQQAFLHEHHGCIRCIRDEEGQVLRFGATEGLEHEVCGVHASGRATDAGAHTVVVLGAQRLGDIAQTVVAALSPTDLELNGVEGDIEFIVHNDDVVGVDAVELGNRTDRAAGGVHVAEGLHKNNLGAAKAEAPLHHNRRGLGMLLEAAANFLGELVQNHLTNIVAGFSVAGAGVS